MDTQISLGQLIGIMGGSFALSTAVIGFLVRALLKSYQERSKLDMEAFRLSVRQDLETFRASLNGSESARKECEGRHAKSAEKLEAKVDGLQEKWVQFVKEDSAMEATRGRKVEALFGVVDSMKETVREIRPAVFRKVEEMHSQAKVELRNELRSYVRGMKDNPPEDANGKR